MSAETETLEASEQHLVERARRGDRQAFDRLVEAHLAAVWRVVFRILRNREDAEDVVQEVFIAAHRALPGFRGESRFSTWLHRIAVTRALNFLERPGERMKKATRSLDEPGRGDDGDDRAPLMRETVADPSPSALRALESRDLMRRLADCFSRLPAVWKAVVALRDGEALPYEEIARVLGLALGTVRSRLARARLALRECVEGGAP